jgi:ABC-type branched-subunit amino acid transport system ATPase component
VSDVILDLAGINVTYPGGAIGVERLDFSVERGEVVALLGRNGAGKTSALRAISGFLPAERVRVRGCVKLKGVDITGQPPYRVNRAGIVYVPERDRVFPLLTVEEHLRVVGGSGVNSDRVFTEFPRLARHRATKGSGLSGGERQMLALALAWLRRPELLLVDEASFGLAPEATQAVADTIERLVETEGTAVVIVDQETSPTVEIASRIVILQQGNVVWSGSRRETSSTKIHSLVIGSTDG